MEHDLTDDLDRRLRAACPHTALLEEDAFDAELLARVRDLPIAARRTVPRAVAMPLAAGVTLTAAAVVMLGGGPGHVGGPSSASAITQALHWLNPSPGTILHARSVETMGTRTTTREFWQSADHPSSERLLIEGTHTYETSGEAFYDPATDTIYDATVPAKAGTDGNAKGADTKKETPVGVPPKGMPGDGTMFIADPIVDKVRTLMADGQMVVSGREVHNGTDAYAISLNPDVGRPVWTLWVSAADGKPLELRDPGRDANEQPQLVRWTSYEVLPDANASALLTLTGAHPSAHVSHDPVQATAALQRLEPKN